MFRRVGVLILSLGLMLGYGGTAEAGPWWCEDDPILHFSDGTSVHIGTSFSAVNPSGRSVTYDVVVPTGTGVRQTYPAAGQIPSYVHVASGGPAGSATITVRVSPGTFDILVTQVGGRSGRQTHHGSSLGTTFSVTLGG
jgi:hypothetical protein